jgi:hypothetical protein
LQFTLETAQLLMSKIFFGEYLGLMFKPEVLISLI